MKISARRSSRKAVVGSGAAMTISVSMRAATVVENWALWGLTIAGLSKLPGATGVAGTI